MGLEAVAAGAASRSLPSIARALAEAGITAMIGMIDGALVTLGPPPERAWRDVRVRTPAGTLTLLKRGDDIAVVVFGNADEALLAMQARVATALRP
jgi:precorrin isomerase